MDLTNTIVPKSDQLNSDDLIAGPRTFTVTEVRVKSTTEQPVDIHLAESPGKPFRPSKTVLRVLVTAWGKEGDEYVGRRMTLYRDAEVKWAGQEVGGIRVSALSHITKQIKLALTETRGKKVTHIVQPLADARPATAGITDQQLEQLAAAFRAANITDRDAGLAYLSQTTGREVASSKELTEPEASAVLKALADSQPTEPTLPGADQ
jgi:hypothetical protein